MKKNKQVLTRLLTRKGSDTPKCPDICWQGQLYHQEWKDGVCQRTGAALGPCPDIKSDGPENKSGSPMPAIIENPIDPDSFDPPLVCWKGKYYRQKWVDGGLEAYGDPLGDC